MAITNKSIIQAIKKANKYIETLEKKGLGDSLNARRLREAVQRSAPGSKPRKGFAGARIKPVKNKKSKQYQKQRKQLLKVYEEIQANKKYFKAPSKIKTEKLGTYTMGPKAKEIRESLATKYNADANLFTDEFFNFISSDEMSIMFNQFEFASDFIRETIEQIKMDNSKLRELDDLRERIRLYIEDPHRDDYYIEDFEDIFKAFFGADNFGGF